MVSFLLRRAVSGIVLVIAAATLTFFLMTATGGDPARNVLGETATQEQVDAKTVELGLDRPVLTRYLDWLGDALTGDFGTSWVTHDPVTETLRDRFPVTLSVVLLAVGTTAIFAVALGTFAAARGGWADRGVQIFAILGFALPNFWLALVLVTTFAVNWGILPATGYTPLTDDPSAWLEGLILPVASLVAGTVASTAQQVRGATLDVLGQDYVRTLRARGVSNRSLYLRHVLRNAAPPALTVLSLQFIGLLGGAVIIERIFALPGVGNLTINATLQGDIPMILGIVVVMVVLVVVVNLLIDLITGWLNPKARLA